MWPTLILVQCLLVAASVGQFHSSTGIVKLKFGSIVRGSLVAVNSDATRKVFYYAGIPYGKADRFEKAKPAPAWSDMFNATEEGPSCPQRVSAKYKLIQGNKIDESCLVLNVWRPASWKTFRAVIFFIHLGGFTSGSIFAPINDAKHFAERGDMIVVAPNYRFGPFGFSHFGEKNADSPTNLGMHDLMLALQWVKENIAEFSGDPNFITIMGSSSGSAAAGTFVLSPLASGLFQKAILLSGAPNSIFGVASKEVALQRTTELATAVGCTSEPIKECLKKKTAIELVQAIRDDPNNFSLFTPLYGDDFLPISPFEALKSGNFNRKIDLLFGMNEVDGGDVIALQNPELTDNSAKLTVERAKVILKATFKKLGSKVNTDDLTKQYIGSLSSPTSDQLKIAISKAFGDYVISCPLLFFGQSMAIHEPTNHYYCYRLAQRSLVGDLLNLPGWVGPLHGEDLTTLFNYPEKKRDSDKQLREDFTRAVIAFLKTGNTGQMGMTLWEEAFAQGKGESRTTRYMRLNVTDYRMEEEKTCGTFWRDRIEL